MDDSTMTEAYRHADNGSQSLIGASFALLALTTIFFALFLASRYYNESAIGPLMFWLIVFGYIFNTGNSIDNALSAILGDAGKHVTTLSPSTNIASGKIGKAADYLYIPSAILPKLAMLAFYHQVFPGHTYRYIIYGSAALLICTLVAGLFQSTFICRPFSAYWTGDGECGDLMETYRWLSWPNLFTDLVMLVMPFPVLLRLQISAATKVKLIITFMTGSLGIITALLRITSFYTVPIFTDPTWYLINPSIYSVVEPSAYLICAIMPALRLFMRRIARYLGLSSTSTSTSTSTSRRRGRGYTSYTQHTGGGPAQSVSSRVREKLGSISLSKKGNLGSGSRPETETETDIEMQRPERAYGMGEPHGKEILCQTDVTMHIERKSEVKDWGKKSEAERGRDGSLDASGNGFAFGDEVPLHGATARVDAGAWR